MNLTSSAGISVRGSLCLASELRSPIGDVMTYGQKAEFPPLAISPSNAQLVCEGRRSMPYAVPQLRLIRCVNRSVIGWSIVGNLVSLRTPPRSPED